MHMIHFMLAQVHVSERVNGNTVDFNMPIKGFEIPIEVLPFEFHFVSGSIPKGENWGVRFPNQFSR